MGVEQIRGDFNLEQEDLKPLLRSEQTVMQAESEFFENLAEGVTDPRDVPECVGLLTSVDPRILLTNYRKMLDGILIIYSQIESPVSSDLGRKFLEKFLVSKLEVGELVNNDQVKKIRNEFQEGSYTRQLAAYGTRLDQKSREEENQGFLPYRRYRTINTKADIVYNSRVVHATFLDIQNVLQARDGVVDYKSALLAELLILSPFTEAVASGQTTDEEVAKRHESYIRDALEFVRRFNPQERFQNFFKLVQQYSTDWTYEPAAIEFPNFDKEYLKEALHLTNRMLTNDWKLGEVHDLLRRTIFRRAKIIKARISGKEVVLEPSSNQSTSFDDIGGYQEQKNFYLRVIDKLRGSGDRALSELRIILAMGEPGVGKSLGVLAFLNSLPENAVGIVLDYYQALTDQGIMPEYEKIVYLAKLHPELHIFGVIEDIDAVAGDRLSHRFTKELLEIDSALPEGFPTNFHLIATTNRPDIIDPALIRPGRTSKILVYEKPRSLEDRIAIVTLHVQKYGVNLSSGIIDLIAKKSAKLSPDEIRHIVWSISFEELNTPSENDINRFVAEIRRKHKMEKEAAGFKREEPADKRLGIQRMLSEGLTIEEEEGDE